MATASKALTLLQRAEGKLESYKTKYAHAREATKATVGTVVRTATIGTTAFAFGVVNGRSEGGIEVGTVPLEAIVGGVTWLAGLFGVAGDHSHHLVAIGDGAIAALATTFGMGVGQSWDEKVKKAKALSASKSSGGAPADSKTLAKGTSMTPEELDQALHG